MLLLVAFGVTQNTLSQVTIGSGAAPNPNALLDLTQGTTTTKGLLLPRVNLVSEDSPLPMTAHTEGMTVYNLAFSDDAVPANNQVIPGVYYNTGKRWERLHVGHTNWLYMPSIIIDVSETNPEPVDLYAEYLSQFENIPAGYASLGAPATFKNILQRDEIFYYVTSYDEEVFTIVSLTAEGILTYTVNVENITEATHMNIVFVEKK